VRYEYLAGERGYERWYLMLQPTGMTSGPSREREGKTGISLVTEPFRGGIRHSSLLKRLSSH
jgi:hypothetical protein